MIVLDNFLVQHYSKKVISLLLYNDKLLENVCTNIICQMTTNILFIFTHICFKPLIVLYKILFTFYIYIIKLISC